MADTDTMGIPGDLSLKCVVKNNEIVIAICFWSVYHVTKELAPGSKPFDGT